MPLLDLFWTMLWFFLFVAWIWLLISIVADVFISGISGWAKAGWTFLIIMLPLLGCLIYLLVHGDDMQDRRMASAVAADQAQRDYIRSVVGEGSSAADEIAKLATLRDEGRITDDEFQAMKSKLLAI